MDTIGSINARMAAATPITLLQPPTRNTQTNAADAQQPNSILPSAFANELHKAATPDPNATRDAFDEFVGNTFYSQMLSSMRKTTSQPAYLNGGRGEEVFRGQLDQVLAKEMTQATKGQFTGPMFDLFSLPRP